VGVTIRDTPGGPLNEIVAPDSLLGRDLRHPRFPEARMDELESTLKIRVDQRDVDTAMERIKATLEQGVTARFNRAMEAQAGGGGGAVSTGSPWSSPIFGGGRTLITRDQGAPGGGGGGGGGGPPRAKSTADGAADGGGRGGGGGDDDLRERARRRRFGLQPGSTAGGGGGATSLQSMVGLAQQALNSPVSTLANIGFKSITEQFAEASAARTVAGGAIGMAGALATKAFEGLGKNADVARHFGGYARELALAGRAGALTRDNGIWGWSGQTGADRGYDVIDPRRYWKTEWSRHGFTVGESTENLAEYRRGTGIRDYGRAVDFGTLAAAGVDPGEVGRFRGLKRFGFSDEATDPTRLVALAQGMGLEGPAITRMVAKMTHYIERMAMKGVQVSPGALVDFMRGAQATPGLGDLGERSQAAYESLGAMGGNIGDQMKSVAQQFAQAYVNQDVMRAALKMEGGATPLNLMRASARYASEPNLALGALQRAGLSNDMRTFIGAGAMPSLTIDQARDMTRPGAVMDRRGRNLGENMKLDVRGVDRVRDADTGNSIVDFMQLVGKGELDKLLYTMIDAKQASSVDAVEWGLDNWTAVGTAWIAEAGRNTEETRKLNETLRSVAATPAAWSEEVARLKEVLRDLETQMRMVNEK
jgi:hypothetical protein